jgi:hypothetical protein
MKAMDKQGLLDIPEVGSRALYSDQGCDRGKRSKRKETTPFYL